MYIDFILTVLFVFLLSACSAATQAASPIETSQPTAAPILLGAISTPKAEHAQTFPPTPAPSLTLTPVNTPTGMIPSVSLTFTPLPVILADTFFTGCALLDKNANGLVDSEDAPIGGMRFMVTLSGGTGFGNLTSDKDGCALVIIPGALPRESWPIVAQMEVPQTFAYVPVGDVKILLVYADTRADFLFSQP